METADNKTTTFDIFKALELANLYVGKNIEISVNTKIQHFERIIKLFEKYQIEHTVYTPESNPPKRFDLHFGKGIDFQDLFIVVAILKNFGLQAIFYEKKKGKEVTIGSYITECGDSYRLPISDGISVDDFLILPFYMTTTEFLSQIFGVENFVLDEIHTTSLPNIQLFDDDDDGENESDEYDDDREGNYDDWYDDWGNDDWGNIGCGEGYSCSQCSNYGCNAHPCN